MITALGRFFLSFTIYTAIIALIVIGVAQVTEQAIWMSKNFWLLYIFQYFLTMIVYSLSLWGIKKGGEYGVFTVLGGIVIKLLMSLSLFLVVLLKSSDNQLVLGLNFFSIYLLQTVFEVTYLLRNLRHQN